MIKEFSRLNLVSKIIVIAFFLIIIGGIVAGISAIANIGNNRTARVGDILFSQKLVSVKQGDKWGFANKNGKVVIEAKYDDVKEFAEGLAPVKVDGKWGAINKAGKLVIEAKYTSLGVFYDGVAPAADENFRYGYINTKGKKVVDFIYDNAEEFSNGLGAVCHKNKGFGYINKKGKPVIDLQYESVGAFSEEGLAIVYKAGKSGLINKKNKYVLEAKYTILSYVPADDCYYMIDDEGNVGYANNKGKKMDKAPESEKKNLKVVTLEQETGTKYGIEDKNGKTKVEKEYDLLKIQKGDEVAVFLKDNKYGLMTTKGKVLAKDFEAVSEITEDGYFIIRKDGKYGIMNTKGKIVVEPKFDALYNRQIQHIVFVS